MSRGVWITGVADTVSGILASEITNFSYEVIAASTTLTVPINQLMLLLDSITIDGTLVLDGNIAFVV